MNMDKTSFQNHLMRNILLSWSQHCPTEKSTLVSNSACDSITDYGAFKSLKRCLNYLVWLIETTVIYLRK